MSFIRTNKWHFLHFIRIRNIQNMSFIRIRTKKFLSLRGKSIVLVYEFNRNRKGIT